MYPGLGDTDAFLFCDEPQLVSYVDLWVRNPHFTEISTGFPWEHCLIGSCEMDGEKGRIADKEIIHGGNVSVQDCSAGGCM